MIKTNAALGKRLAALRKQKGLSQDELATLMKLNRTSITQIELGKRSIDFFELQNAASALGVSLDDFLKNDPSEDKFLEVPAKMGKKDSEVRISVPQLKVEKFKQVLLYILERCAGKPNVGETVLYKLLYFCDFNYYEIYEEHLTGATYRKLPLGPVPYTLDSILNKMIEKEELKRVKVNYHGYPQTRYMPLIKADLRALNGSEKQVIDSVIEQFSDWSASDISQYSHLDMPCKATKENDIIDYELAFYREKPFSARNYDGEDLE